MSEEGDDREAPSPEMTSLLSYTLRYISFTEVRASAGLRSELLTDKVKLCEVVYYESLKRELKTKTINGCRCDERLKN